VSIDFCLRNFSAVADWPLFIPMEVILKHEDGQVVVDHDRLAKLRTHGKAVLFRSMPGVVEGIDQVSVDLHSAFTSTVRHLVDQGHRHMAMLCGKLSNLWFKPRFQGFLDSLAAAGLACDPRLVEITSGLNAQEDDAAMDRLLAQSPRPTAVVCANDRRALHVLEYCRTHHINVPGQLAVTGFDNIFEGSLSTPALTTLDPCITQTAQAMFELTQPVPADRDGQEAHQQVVITPQLVVRGST
jgi:DNA-binding LacI/PurR family transcriptional regulator